MSEKVTFQELIESIAEETDNSKQFTHDFLKDFVDVINGGLEQDGKVNIAGFGKFELRRVDEREGYNPQTEEKMTIPAHNKIVFKPYKDLRELVNAPYAHLESELIEEDEDEDETDDVEPTEEKSGQDDFIPTAPPTAKKSLDETNDSSDEQDKDSFETTAQEESGDDSVDIVEFDKDQSDKEEQETDNELDEFIGRADQEENETPEDSEATESSLGQEEETEESEEHSDEQEEAPMMEEFSKEPEEKSTDEQVAAPSIRDEHHTRKKSSSLPLVIAAAFILLLVVGGAWYLGILNDSDNTPQMADQEQVSNPEQSTPANNQQSRQKDAQSQQKSTKGNKDTQNKAQQRTTAATADQANKSESETIGIQKGQTLWSIAEDKYGNPRLWPWIYGNNNSLEDPDLILAGNSLSVPLPSGPQNSLTSGDSIGVAKGYLDTYRWYKNNQSTKAKHHLWAAKIFYDDIRSIADVQIDEADLAYANRAR